MVPDTVGPRLACGCVCRQASLPFSPTSPFARTPSFLELEERSLRKGQKELPHVQGKGQRPRVPGCDGAGTAERSYPVSEVRGGGREELLHVRPRPGAAAERTYPTPEARGRCREEQPHLQGVVAARAQESLDTFTNF